MLPPLSSAFPSIFLLTALLFASGTALFAAKEVKIVPLSRRPAGPPETHFTTLTPETTGIIASNAYADPHMWGDLYHEFDVGSIGTGIAVGDFDGDGKPDIFVVSKTESCRLFHNLGKWKFEDVTDKAGVADKGAAAMVWKQGASFVDVNNDGWLDIYVCRFNAPNLLYINQGDGTFKEMAQAAGLDVTDASVMASFCDYDRDGWLDLCLVTNLLDSKAHPKGQRTRLFHNRGDGSFEEVTRKAGIDSVAQGHAATWWDYNEDGWPDLYLSNDFDAPDRLYRNCRNGIFEEVIGKVLPVMPYYSMGADMGDVDNDGHQDLFVTEMASSSREKDQRGMIQLRSHTEVPRFPGAPPPQENRSMLFLGTGTGRCLEVGRLAGVQATDWTWGPRLEDLDNDGRLDLFVTNGMYRDANNIDLLARMLAIENLDRRISLVRASPVLNQRSFAFRNDGDLHFTDVGAKWGLDHLGVSFGCAFGDFDGDGDLDLVVADYLTGPRVLRNDSSGRHNLMVALHGTASNRFGVGATVTIETASGRQVRTLHLSRGYLSTSEPVLHFGVGDATMIHTLSIAWPSGRLQVLHDLSSDILLTVTEPESAESNLTPTKPDPVTLLHGEPLSTSLDLRVVEPSIDELEAQRLLPRHLNRTGPALAVLRLEGENRDAVVVGGTPLTPARIIVNTGKEWKVRHQFPAIKVNDGPLLAFDADGDGRSDLLATASGNSLPDGDPAYVPRLFLQRDNASWQPVAVPDFPASIGAVAAADIDGDGLIDVFLGADQIPGQYPVTPFSALWHNRGGGSFEDVTEALAPMLRKVGCVRAALFSDLDMDGRPDLVVATEWGGVRVFHNDGAGHFSDGSNALGFEDAGNGWWSALAVADLNGDGRPDFVVGNEGLNTDRKPRPKSPSLLYRGSFEGDDSPAVLIEAIVENGHPYPVRSRRDLAAVIPNLIRRFPKNDVFATASLETILGPALERADRYSVTEARTGVFLSQPSGRWRFVPLPWQAQVAPVRGIVITDLNRDGHLDLILGQNDQSPYPPAGRNDGGLGIVLLGDGRGGFTPLAAAESGLVVPGDTRSLILFDAHGDGARSLLISRNDDTPLLFTLR